MKGFGVFVVLTISYVLLMLLISGAFGQSQGNNNGQASQKQQNSSSNPIVNLFQLTDPTTVQAMDAIYGSYNGDDQCQRKSACIAGNSVKDMPGRDLFFILLQGYIPQAYSIYYDIFRNSALYGQNCEIYLCISPNSNKPNVNSSPSPPR